MIYFASVSRTPITRARALRIAENEKIVKNLLNEIGGHIAGIGEASIIVKFEFKTPSGKTIVEMLPFELYHNALRVRYSNFFPYGRQTYLKKHYGSDQRLLNIIESYLRSKGATYTS